MLSWTTAGCHELVLLESPPEPGCHPCWKVFTKGGWDNNLVRTSRCVPGCSIAGVPSRFVTDGCSSQ